MDMAVSPVVSGLLVECVQASASFCCFLFHFSVCFCGFIFISDSASFLMPDELSWHAYANTMCSLKFF